MQSSGLRRFLPTCEPVPSEIQVCKLREVAPRLRQRPCTDECVCVCRNASKGMPRARVRMQAQTMHIPQVHSSLAGSSRGVHLKRTLHAQPGQDMLRKASGTNRLYLNPGHHACQPVVAEIQVREPHQAVPAARQRPCGAGMWLHLHAGRGSDGSQRDAPERCRGQPRKWLWLRSSMLVSVLPARISGSLPAQTRSADTVHSAS